MYKSGALLGFQFKTNKDRKNSDILILLKISSVARYPMAVSIMNQFWGDLCCFCSVLWKLLTPQRFTFKYLWVEHGILNLISNQNLTVVQKKVDQPSADSVWKGHYTLLCFIYIYIKDFQIGGDKKKSGTSQYNLPPILKKPLLWNTEMLYEKW